LAGVEENEAEPDGAPKGFEFGAPKPVVGVLPKTARELLPIPTLLKPPPIVPVPPNPPPMVPPVAPSPPPPLMNGLLPEPDPKAEVGVLENGLPAPPPTLPNEVVGAPKELFAVPNGEPDVGGKAGELNEPMLAGTPDPDI